MSKHNHNHNSQPRRWTLKDGKVVEISQYEVAPLSIRAPYKQAAEVAFIRMARNVLFIKPRLILKNGAFLFVYHDGEKFCAESGPEDMAESPPSCNRYETLKEAQEDGDFKVYSSDQYQIDHHEEVVQKAMEAVAVPIP
jgi:hypothetical protein